MASSAMFGAPTGKTSGPAQQNMHADMLILPGGIILINQDSPLAKLEIGRPVSGPILCNEERNNEQISRS